MVSAALVAESESSDKQGASPTSSGPDKDGSVQPQEEKQKKMVQRPVYFVSSLLQGARSRYTGVQKLLFGLLMASRKLRHYFQAHEITVVTRFSVEEDIAESRSNRQDRRVGTGIVKLWPQV